MQEVMGALLTFCFFLNDPATTEIYTLSLHDALPIYVADLLPNLFPHHRRNHHPPFLHLRARSEEHTSELQSQSNLVCRLLLEKKNNSRHNTRLIGTPLRPGG